MRGDGPAYIGLGANLGSMAEITGALWAAIQELGGTLDADAVPSSIYRTAPVGAIRDQPEFLNAVIALQFRGSVPTARRILELCLEVERKHGRDRSREVPGGPRPLDLDFLLWGGLVVDDPRPPPLELPHPRLGRRVFALAPLVELAGEDLAIPGVGRAGDLLRVARADPAQSIVEPAGLARRFNV